MYCQLLLVQFLFIILRFCISNCLCHHMGWSFIDLRLKRTLCFLLFHNSLHLVWYFNTTLQKSLILELSIRKRVIMFFSILYDFTLVFVLWFYDFSWAFVDDRLMITFKKLLFLLSLLSFFLNSIPIVQKSIYHIHLLLFLSLTNLQRFC